uniref:Uncharacterized protein n=1 Tax=Romanomermis culicivorax TaxID=13658 RepID=A0A915HUT4_ROMCU
MGGTAVLSSATTTAAASASAASFFCRCFSILAASRNNSFRDSQNERLLPKTRDQLQNSNKTYIDLSTSRALSFLSDVSPAISHTTFVVLLVFLRKTDDFLTASTLTAFMIMSINTDLGFLAAFDSFGTAFLFDRTICNQVALWLGLLVPPNRKWCYIKPIATHSSPKAFNLCLRDSLEMMANSTNDAKTNTTQVIIHTSIHLM